MSEAVREGEGASVRTGERSRAARWTIRGFVLALAGIVMTVVVAWVAALWAPTRLYNWTKPDSPFVFEYAGSTFKGSHEHRRIGFRERLGFVVKGTGELPPLKPNMTAWRNRLEGWEGSFGWPALSLQCKYRGPSRKLDEITNGLVLARSRVLDALGAELASPFYYGGGREYRPLPIVVMWPGFAMSVVFWSMAIAALWFVPATIRAALRRHRGVCVKCAYDVRGLPVCPECGTSSGAVQENVVAKGVAA